jgi:hypothetical protein
MKTANLTADGVAMGNKLWNGWTLMWNGQVSEAQTIIADGFYAHLTKDQLADPAQLRDATAVMAWVGRIRGLYQELVYSYATDAGPFIDVHQQVISCHWQARGIYAGRTNAPLDMTGKAFQIVGNDILKFRDGKICECWTISKHVPVD